MLIVEQKNEWNISIHSFFLLALALLLFMQIYDILLKILAILAYQKKSDWRLNHMKKLDKKTRTTIIFGIIGCAMMYSTEFSDVNFLAQPAKFVDFLLSSGIAAMFMTLMWGMLFPDTEDDDNTEATEEKA